MIRRAQTMTRALMGQPVRTCIGCRQRAAVSDLLRVVALGTGADVSLTPDPRRALPGRGAHVHPNQACLESALRRRAFGRALRVTGVLDAQPVSEAIHGSTDPNGSSTQ